MTAQPCTKPLDTLAAELWDFIGTAPDLDLPPLSYVGLRRWDHSAGWECEASVKHVSAAADIDAVYAYANYAGSPVRIMTPYRGSSQPSGWQVSLITVIVVGGVSIEIAANMDADEYAAAMAEDRSWSVVAS